MFKKCIDTTADPHIALLQIRSPQLGQELPNNVTLLFNCPKRSVMPVFNRPPVNADNDYELCETLVQR